MRIFAALEPDVAAASSVASASENQFFLHILRQCYLLGIGRDDIPHLLEQIRKLPADRQWLWTEVLKVRLSRTDLSVSSHDSLTCRTHANRGIPQVAERDKLAVCQECKSEHQPWKEITASSAVAECIDQLARNEIPRGVSREELYSKIFRGVARISDNCVIVDRYAGLRMTQKEERSGIAWFGDQLVTDGVKRIVLVTASGRVTRTQIEAVGRKLASSRLEQILRIETRPDSLFAKYAHDRFILFQAGRAGCTFSIGKGVEVFESDRVRQQSSLSSSDGAGVSRLLSDLGVNAAAHFT